MAGLSVVIIVRWFGVPPLGGNALENVEHGSECLGFRVPARPPGFIRGFKLHRHDLSVDPKRSLDF